jgi:hypothetical protein
MPAQPDEDKPRGRVPHEHGTWAVLDHFAEGDPEQIVQLDQVLADLEERAFGMLLFLSIPTAFIPGVAGVVSGPLVILVGVQLLFGRSRPWLPKWLARRGPHRHALRRFRDKLGPRLGLLERFIKPRNEVLVDHVLPNAFTGLHLVLLGLLLSLPIPFTNILFAVLLLVFALALLERDGRLVVAAWIASTIAIGFFGVLSGSLAGMAGQWLEMLG